MVYSHRDVDYLLKNMASELDRYVIFKERKIPRFQCVTVCPSFRE